MVMADPLDLGHGKKKFTYNLLVMLVTFRMSASTTSSYIILAIGMLCNFLVFVPLNNCSSNQTYTTQSQVFVYCSVVCCVLSVDCCVLYVVCCVLCIVCCVLFVVVCVLCVVCVVCSM